MRLFALMTALVASTTFAQGACRADREQLCPNLAKGPETRACMKAHLAQLSPTCRQAIRDHAGRKDGRAPAPTP